MRHGHVGAKLSRNASERLALLRNLCTDLLKHQRIETTLAKAKALRPFADRCITLAKRNTEVSQAKILSSYVFKSDSVTRAMELAKRFATRTGGYTRHYRLGRREGDRAEMAVIEFLDNPFPALRLPAAERNALKLKKKQADDAELEEQKAKQKALLPVLQQTTKTHVHRILKKHGPRPIARPEPRNRNPAKKPATA